MNFELGEEEEAVRDLSRQIFADATSFERTREVEADIDGPGFDRTLWSHLAEANLLGLPISEGLGGQGFGFFALCLLLEEAGRSLAPAPLLESIVYAGLPIQQFGGDAIKKECLGRLIRGEQLYTAALFEVGTPTFSRELKTRATAKGASEFSLTGEKICAPYAASAERIIVSASGSDGVGIFLIPTDAPGLVLEAQETTAHERQFVVRLDGVVVGGDSVLGAPGRGEEILSWLEPRATTAIAAVAVGAAEEALRQTAEYTSTRKQFGREIGSFQGVSLRAADAYIDVEAMRSTMWQAAWRIEHGEKSVKAAAVAKWWACMGGHRVSHTCQHLHGGIGSDVDYPIHRYFLRLKHVAMTLGGANEQLAALGAMLASEARAGMSAEEILS